MVDGALRSVAVLRRYTLQEALEAAKGERILFIDICHSGNAYSGSTAPPVPRPI
jgi:hypothetical protein